MLTNIKKKTEGFTIVEVMIVLAIAGMILLAVLLVVPALNRTARNNRRRGDVSSILSAVSEFTSNNNGSLPATDEEITALAKLSFYDPDTEINYTPQATALLAAPGTDNNVVYIRNFAKCNGNAIQTTAGATRRNVVAYFFVETSGTPIAQCQEA